MRFSSLFRDIWRKNFLVLRPGQRQRKVLSVLARWSDDFNIQSARAFPKSSKHKTTTASVYNIPEPQSLASWNAQDTNYQQQQQWQQQLFAIHILYGLRPSPSSPSTPWSLNAYNNNRSNSNNSNIKSSAAAAVAVAATKLEQQQPEVEEKVTTATWFSPSIDLTFLSLNALDPASTLSVLLYLTLPPSGPSRAIAAYSTWKGEETKRNKLRFESLAKVCMASWIDLIAKGGVSFSIYHPKTYRNSRKRWRQTPPAKGDNKTEMSSIELTFLWHTVCTIQLNLMLAKEMSSLPTFSRTVFLYAGFFHVLVVEKRPI